MKGRVYSSSRYHVINFCHFCLPIVGFLLQRRCFPNSRSFCSVVSSNLSHLYHNIFFEHKNSYYILFTFLHQTNKTKRHSYFFIKNILSTLPAIFLSRILRHRASAFRIGQFSTFALKLLKNLYSLMCDIRLPEPLSS